MLLKNLKATANDERPGFAITFEIMMVTLLAATVISIIIYFIEVMNVERFFFDVTASTCTAASRYGGDKSRAYYFQVESNNNGSIKHAKTISENADLFLSSIAARSDRETGGYVFDPVDGRYIIVSDAPDENGYVTVQLQYRLGKYGWGAIAERLIPDGGNIVHTIQLQTLMQSGALLVN